MSFSRFWAASRRWRRGISTSNGLSLSDSSPSPSAAAAQILSYHEETKHAMDRYAKGPTSLDWKNQPNPFRTYNGAETTLLNTQPNATSERPRFSVLWNPQSVQSVPITMEGISHLLFYSLSISAWKKSGKSAWSLRVNPSSGNLHPTEAYVITPPHISQTSQPTLFHYEPKIHALEKRAVYSSDAFGPLDLAGSGRDFLLLGLSSIYWREAWKYGERAFRYCQLDVGHAIAAVRMAAATLGWRVNLLDDGFSTKQLDSILCLDRAQDFPSSQQEESQVLLLITRNGSSAQFHNKVEELAQRLKPLECYGVANSLSSQVRTWDAVNIAAAATVKPQTNTTHLTPSPSNSDEHQSIHANEKKSSNAASIGPYDSADLLTLIRQRRSALAFDPTRSEMPLSVFATIMKGIAASPQIAPFDCWPQEIQTSSTQVHASKLSGKEDISSFLIPAAASDEEEEDLSQWQDDHVHVLLYVHRVQDLAPGLYILVRGQDRRAHAALRQEMPKMMWSEVAEDFDEVGADGELNLFLSFICICADV
eukprot:TRINITY_DN4932_c0_g1_i1.p1 TRINITY_DN4932_c0_g1~~TRINITY_DN4932_c0_g1_i1.p1  ORF type:complete len:536 (+),score=141.29 TRINITY_DN4932_c0_g1_i1:55-1662(+)